jgi:hypothetical protein
MHDRLVVGGIMMFETGNIADVEPRHYVCFSSFQYPDHLFFFGEKSLKLLLAASGFELILMRRYSILLDLFMIRLLTYIRRRGPGPRRRRGDGSGSGQSIPTSVLHRYRRFPGLLRDLFDLSRYVIRYAIGRVILKKGTLETLIIVARRTSS